VSDPELFRLFQAYGALEARAEAAASSLERGARELGELREQIPQMIQEGVAEALVGLAGEGAQTRALLYKHLQGHAMDPVDLNLPADSWDPLRYDPYVAPERMQIRRRGSRVMVLAVALLGAIVGLAHPATGAKIEKLLTVLR